MVFARRNATFTLKITGNIVVANAVIKLFLEKIDYAILNELLVLWTVRSTALDYSIACGKPLHTV